VGKECTVDSSSAKVPELLDQVAPKLFPAQLTVTEHPVKAPDLPKGKGVGGTNGITSFA